MSLRGNMCNAQQGVTLSKLIKGPSWSWSYASGIYNYLFNQCLSSQVDSPVVFFPADEVFHFSIFYIIMWDRRGCDHMVVEFTTIYAISA